MQRGSPGRSAKDHLGPIHIQDYLGFCGPALTGSPAAALWQVKERTRAVQPLGQGRRLEKVFAELIKDSDNNYLMLDTTLVRVYQQAASGKGEPKLRSWGVPEVDWRSRSTCSATVSVRNFV